MGVSPRAASYRPLLRVTESPPYRADPWSTDGRVFVPSMSLLRLRSWRARMRSFKPRPDLSFIASLLLLHEATPVRGPAQPKRDTGRPISQENVELAHQAYDAFNRRDFASLLALVDPDAEVVPRLAGVEGGYHGPEGIRRWWQNLLDAWPDFTVEVVEVRDLGQTTVTKIEVGGHAADSGIRVRQPSWHVWQWRRKKAVWFGVFATEAEALEAVGLRE
jgi:ketosteroid isomerase-like protein